MRRSSSFVVMLRTDRFVLSQLIIIDSDDHYKQVYSISNCNYSQIDSTSFKCLLNNRVQFYLVLVLMLTCQTVQSLPLHSQGRSQPSSTSNMVISLSNDLSRQWLNAPNPSTNGLSIVTPNPSQHSFNPFRRERHRRLMIDRLLILFDEDGNGELSKDEFYSLSLRLNIFPRFHRYFKQTNENQS